MSMPKLNAPAEIHWRRSNINVRDPILMKSVEVLKDCRSLNAAAEMNCPMPRSVEKVPNRNEKRCISDVSHVSPTHRMSIWRVISSSFTSSMDGIIDLTFRWLIVRESCPSPVVFLVLVWRRVSRVGRTRQRGAPPSSPRFVGRS